MSLKRQEETESPNQKNHKIRMYLMLTILPRKGFKIPSVLDDAPY